MGDSENQHSGGKCIAVNIHVLKKERSHISQHTFHSRKKGGKLGGGGKTKLKATERRNNKDWHRENWIEKKMTESMKPKVNFAKINETGIPFN